jgi:NADH-quinone oxidoreductase subunit C
MAKKVLEALSAKFGDAVEPAVQHGDEIAYVQPARLLEVAAWLRDDAAMAFDAPVFVTAVDRQAWQHPAAPDGTALELDADGELRFRFEVCWQLRSSTKRHRLRLKVRATGAAPKVASLAALWPAFDWQERETFDMYGIVFEGHPDLRRIYLYDEFVGYPLRKDYPKDKRQPLVRRDDLAGNPVRKGQIDGDA